MEKRRTVLMIGIDGGTWTVLQPAMDQGYMPFLKRQCEGGASGILESTVPAITPAAWGAFQTGKNPGKTGVYDFSYWDRQQHKNYFVSALNIGTTLWEILGNYGKSVAIINVPMTYPPKPINGFMISGIVTPSPDSQFTWPPELKKELLETIPGYHIFDIRDIAAYRLQEERFEMFIQELGTILENRVLAALWLIKKKPLDVMMVHFQASDFLQHAYWHFLDPTHPLFNDDRRQYIFANFYRTLDQKIEQIYNAFAEKNEEPLFIAVSDHGFQSHFKRFNLGNWLQKEGYLKVLKRGACDRTPVVKRITSALQIGKVLSVLIPKRAINKFDSKYISKTERFCWSDSRAYAVGRSNEGFIYLLPSDAHQQAELSQELSAKLLSLRDPQSGKLIVEKVWLKEQIYRGEKVNYLPDIVLEPSEGYSFTGYYQCGQDLYKAVTFEEDVHIGKHHKDGIIIVSGCEVAANPGIKTSILNITPTVLYYMGIPANSDMDGKVLTELFGQQFRSVAAIRKGRNGLALNESGQEYYGPEEANNIEQKLKDLGYL